MGKRASSRRYSEEFKRDAVALVVSSGRPIAEVARELGVTDTSLGNWMREAARAGGRAGAEGEAELAEEAARLRKRVRDLEQEIDILKRFTAYWVKDSSR